MPQHVEHLGTEFALVQQIDDAGGPDGERGPGRMGGRGGMMRDADADHDGSVTQAENTGRPDHGPSPVAVATTA